MKRTIALVLSLLCLLVLVPTTALADTDVHPYLEVTPVPVAPATIPKTLFQYGADTFNWTSANLVVKLYDDTAANIGGTVLPNMGTVISTTAGAETYVLLLNGKVFDPAVPYTFLSTDLGSKTLTVKYTYKPTGQTNNVTVTKDITISVQANILTGITATNPAQMDYYVGEYVNLSGVTVKGTYTNMADPVIIPSGGYTVITSQADDSNPLPATDPLALLQTKITFTRSETYPGSDTTIVKTTEKNITVSAAATELALKDGAVEVSTLAMTAGDAAKTITADVGAGPKASLVASVDKPAIVDRKSVV